jgi:DDE family transposase
MEKSTPVVRLEAMAFDDEHTAHALLIPIYQKADELGLFERLGARVTIAMRANDYTWLDKLKTLWASIVIGCSHTSQINTLLGAQESALARVFGLERFPDQSGINRLLHRVTPESVAEVRQVAFDLLVRHSRARDRWRWLRLPGGRRVLIVDVDQRGVVVSSRRYELCERAFFGKKRGRHGYRVTLAYLGGQIGEVFDEYFDPGTTPPAARIRALLEQLTLVCRQWQIAPGDVLIRADAAYGTPAIVSLIAAHGFEYLIKGLSRGRAETLLRGVTPEAVFERTADGPEWRWVSDLGEVEHVGRSVGRERVLARTIVGAWVHEVAHGGKRPGPTSRRRREREGTARRRVATPEYWLTSVGAEDLPASACIEVYNARQTIEAYFKAEQQGLGARHVRTHAWAGAALFQWLVAITNNVLKWAQQELVAATELETAGITRLTKQALHVRGRVRRQAHQIIVTLERRHPLVARLLSGWRRLIVDVPPHAQPLPLRASPT